MYENVVIQQSMFLSLQCNMKKDCHNKKMQALPI